MNHRLEITRDSPLSSFTVRCGDLWEDGLTAGEALEVAAGFIFQPDKQPRYLVSDETHAARDRRWKKDPEPVATLGWNWVSAGRWEAESVDMPGHRYVILLNDARFYFAKYGIDDAVMFSVWHETMKDAQDFCEQSERISAGIDVPF